VGTGTGSWYLYQVRSSRRIEAVVPVRGDFQQYRYRRTLYRYPIRRVRRIARA